MKTTHSNDELQKALPKFPLPPKTPLDKNIESVRRLAKRCRFRVALLNLCPAFLLRIWNDRHHPTQAFTAPPMPVSDEFATWAASVQKAKSDNEARAILAECQRDQARREAFALLDKLSEAEKNHSQLTEEFMAAKYDAAQAHRELDLVRAELLYAHRCNGELAMMLDLECIPVNPGDILEGRISQFQNRPNDIDEREADERRGTGD